MKTNKISIIIILFTLLNTFKLFADDLPFQPGDPGMSVPIDGGILMALLSVFGLVAMLFKKKKKD